MKSRFWVGSAMVIAAAVATASGIALAATLFVNGQQCGTFVKDPGAGTVTINCSALTVATPTPVGGPTPTPQPTSGDNGGCPSGYTLLNINMSFANNTFGLDFQTVPAGQTNHYCAVLADTVSATALLFATADRTGPSQCSFDTLTVTPPAGSGLSVRSSTATNNTIRYSGVIPAGTYLVDVTGNASFGNCVLSSTYMVYWQYR